MKTQLVVYGIITENNPPLNDDDPPTVNFNADPITNCGSFKYKKIITGKTSNANQENDENTEDENIKTKKNLEIVVPLKHLSNFQRTLEAPLINAFYDWKIRRNNF